MMVVITSCAPNRALSAPAMDAQSAPPSIPAIIASGTSTIPGSPRML